MAPIKADADKAPPQPILFVDVQKTKEKEVKTQIRSHLMHEHIRQRTIQRAENLKSAVQFPQRFIPSHPKHNVSASRPLSERSAVPSVSASSKPPLRPSKDKALLDAVNKRLQDDEQSCSAVVRLPNPLTALSSLRRDSFSSYPLELDSDGHMLVDLWLTNFPLMTQLNLSPGIESIYAPTRNVFFPLAMSSPAAFETTVLHFAALHRAKMKGVDNDRHTIYHRIKALELTQDRVQGAIQRGEKSTDGDLVAVLSLGTAECRFGDPLAASIHLQGARQLVRRRREQGALPQDRKLDLLFNWYNINTPISSHNEAACNPRVYAELESDFEYFRTVLDNFHALALLQKSAELRLVAPRLASHLRLDPALCRILVGPSEDSPMYRHFAFQMARFLVLLHIHMALWFYRDDLARSEEYLKQLSLRVVELDLEFKANPVFLLAWTILSDPVLHNSLRGWLVSRISVIFKLLGMRTRHEVLDFLLALLVLEEDKNGELMVPLLDKNQLENEVLRFQVDYLGHPRVET